MNDRVWGPEPEIGSPKGQRGCRVCCCPVHDCSLGGRNVSSKTCLQVTIKIRSVSPTAEKAGVRVCS